MTLAGNVRVSNHSGEDYESARVRLVVGVIRLVEEIAQLARTAVKDQSKVLSMTETLARQPEERDKLYFGLAEGGALADRKPREIVKEGLSEYFLYTVEGRDTIPNGWSKRMPSFKTDGVPLTSYYKFAKERFGDRVRRSSS